MSQNKHEQNDKVLFSHKIDSQVRDDFNNVAEQEQKKKFVAVEEALILYIETVGNSPSLVNSAVKKYKRRTK